MEKKNIHDAIVDELCNSKITATVYLINGFQFRGNLISMDDTVVVMEVDGRQQMIYRHALSTIVPHYPLETLTSHSL